MACDKHTVVLRFLDDSPAEANLATQRLSEFIQAEAAHLPGAQPELSLRKEKDDTLDLGSTLVLVFGTPFAIAIAKGVAAYIQAMGSRVVIETPDGHVIASGDGAKNIDVARTVTALQARAVAETKRKQLEAKAAPPAKALPPAKAKPHAAKKSTPSRKATKK